MFASQDVHVKGLRHVILYDGRSTDVPDVWVNAVRECQANSLQKVLWHVPGVTGWACRDQFEGSVCAITTYNRTSNLTNTGKP